MAVIEGDVFDALFRMNPQRNAEGEILGACEFAAHVIDRTVTGEPLQGGQGPPLSGLTSHHRSWADAFS